MARQQRLVNALDVSHGKTPEGKLWTSVVVTAACDALHAESWNSQRTYDRTVAREWFNGNSRDFKEVCKFAGYDPDYVRKKMKERMEEKSDQETNMPPMYGKRLHQSTERPSYY